MFLKNSTILTYSVLPYSYIVEHHVLNRVRLLVNVCMSMIRHTVGVFVINSSNVEMQFCILLFHCHCVMLIYTLTANRTASQSCCVIYNYIHIKHADILLVNAIGARRSQRLYNTSK